MPISSAIKGVESIKTLHTVKKSAASNNSSPDFIKMYMLDKERTRLLSEEILISNRLQTIQTRLSEIRAYYNEKSIQLQDNEIDESSLLTEKEKTVFKTMSIDY